MIFIIFILLLLVGGGAVAAVVVNYVKEAPPFDPTQLATVETSYIYDSSGNAIAALHEEQNRVVVTLNQIPQHVQEAFIAIEDERFFNHFGFDITASLRAAYINFRAGEILQGGSTITQQLAQNAFLTQEKTYRRKIQEIWLALQLEQIYSKEEILEMYLNRIYFGNGSYGVEAAARTYFDKGVSDLTLAEAAMLAGAVRAPNFFNPFDNLLAAEARMRVVLASMNRLNLVNENQYQSALQEQLEYALPQSPEFAFPFFVDYVVHHELIRILSAMPGINSRQEAYQAIYNHGLRIYTTMDPDLQLHVEEVLARRNLYPSTIYLDMPRVREVIRELPAGRDLAWNQLQELMVEEGGVAQPQAAIVVADPVTGKIKALGGGRNYQKNVDVLLRFTTLRQPGSAIKPVIAYAPAFNEGVLAGAGTTLDDSPFTGPHGWQPKNFDNRFRGPISARVALYYSYNVPAVRLFQALNPRVGAGYAQKMGISTITPEEVDNLSLSLGGFTYGVSAIDMAQAYSVLANNGVKVDLHTVEKIVDSNGRVLYEHKSDPQQIISHQAAFLVNDILQDFVTEYLGRALQLGRPVAAKTGTTENWNDVYLVAYTPNLVAAFWMGYDEPKLGSIQQGWRFSTVFLREVFLEAFKNLEIKDFIRPDGIIRVEICSVSGMRPNDLCRASGTVSRDYFIARHVPNWLCDYHVELPPLPGDPTEEDPVPEEPVPEEPLPEEPVPEEPAPGEPVPGEPAPGEPVPPAPNWWE